MNSENLNVIQAIVESDTDEFIVLARIAGLTDPKTDFRYSDLSGVEFGTCDLSNYDFTGSDLRGANLQATVIENAIFNKVDADIHTKWPLSPPKTARLLDSYDPNWKQELEYHHNAFDKTHKQGEQYTVEIKDKLDFHLKKSVNAEVKRFRTIDDYVEGRFWSPISHAETYNIPYEKPKFADGTTLDQLHEAFSRFSDEIEGKINWKRNQMPEGQPEGFDIFVIEEDNEIYSKHCRFEMPYLHFDLLALVSYDLRDDGTNICLSFVPGEPSGMAVMNNYEFMISEVYCGLLAASRVDKSHGGSNLISRYRTIFSRFRENGLGALWYANAALMPKNMRFYLHMPPTKELSGQEHFWRVSMQYQHGKFRNPKFEELESVPSYFKNVRISKDE